MATSRTTRVVVLLAGIAACAAVAILGVAFLGGVYFGVRRSVTSPEPVRAWTTDADGCPEACRRAGDCHLEAFLGEGCVDSCESGVEVFDCIRKARSCDEMEKCR